jgi:hypothetical protein
MDLSMRSIRQLLAVLLVAMVWLFIFSGGVSVNEQKAKEASPKNFFEMSIEELMEVEIVAQVDCAVEVLLVAV